MYKNEQLIILDADGTTIDAFSAIAKTFSQHGMDLGELEKFQKRRHIFKYIGGVKDFPYNLSKQLGKRTRAKIVATLTEVYRDEAELFPGIADLLRTLMETPKVRVGLITRNITLEPLETLQQLFSRHGIETPDLDFFIHVPLTEEKTDHFRSVREQFDINPARAFACGDERKDYRAALSCGMHPFMVSYGFEDHTHLTTKVGVPEEIIARTPDELSARVQNALGIEVE